MWQTTWNYIVGWVRQESAATTAIVQAFIALGIAFSWWTWTSAQTGAVVGIVAALLGMFVRSQVSPLHPLKARTARAPGTIHGPPAGPATRRAPGAAAAPPPGPAGPGAGEPGRQP